MTNEVISPLRRRMIEDMTIRKLSPKTQQSYIRTIKSLAAFLGPSPDKASFEDIRRFQLHAAAHRVRRPRIAGAPQGRRHLDDALGLVVGRHHRGDLRVAAIRRFL
jgi:hypothetical protein